MSNKYVSMQEATEILGVSYKTVQRMVKDKKLKSRKKGNTREVLLEALGQDKDTSQDNVRDKDRTSPRTKGQPEQQTEVGFLREMIVKQQGTIEEQNGRLAELNRLVLGNQQTLAELSKTLQLTAGVTRTDETDNIANDLGQAKDSDKTDNRTMSESEAKNKPLQRSKRRFNVLYYVLIPVFVILATALVLILTNVLPVPPLLK